jgi:hypothetical protein
MGIGQSRRKGVADMSLGALTTAPGTGGLCDRCHDPIDASQVEWRCAAPGRASGAPLRLHQWCYYAKSLARA